MNVNNNYATDHGNSHPIGYAVYLSGVIPAGIYEVDNNREMLKSHFRIAGLYVSVNKQTLYVPFPWLSEISYGANDVTHQNSTLEFDYYLPSGTKYGIAFKVSTSLDLDTSTVTVTAEGQVTRQPMVHNIEDLDEIAELATMQASGFDYDFAKVQGSEKYITDDCNKTIVKVVNTWFNSVGISLTSIVNEYLKLAYKYVTPKLTTLFVKEMIKTIHAHTSYEGFGGIFFGRVENPEPLTRETCSRLVAASHAVLVKIGKHPVYNSVYVPEIKPIVEIPDLKTGSIKDLPETYRDSYLTPVNESLAGINDINLSALSKYKVVIRGFVIKNGKGLFVFVRVPKQFLGTELPFEYTSQAFLPEEVDVKICAAVRKNYEEGTAVVTAYVTGTWSQDPDSASDVKITHCIARVKEMELNITNPNPVHLTPESFAAALVKGASSLPEPDLIEEANPLQNTQPDFTTWGQEVVYPIDSCPDNVMLRHFEVSKNRQQDSYVLDQVAASVLEAGTKFPFNEEPNVLKKPTVVWTSENGKVIVPTIATKVPKSTVDSILATVKLQFHRFPGTNGVIAVAHLPDGFIVSTGVGSCVHGPNFNEAAGIEAASEQAMRKAEDKIWEMQGTLLREQIIENIKQQETLK